MTPQIPHKKKIIMILNLPLRVVYFVSFCRCEEFAEAIVGLNAAYLGRIKAQIMKWVQNLRSQHLEPQLDADGHYVTTLPDMFNLINMQVYRTARLNGRARKIFQCY